MTSPRLFHTHKTSAAARLPSPGSEEVYISLLQSLQQAITTLQRMTAYHQQQLARSSHLAPPPTALTLLYHDGQFNLIQLIDCKHTIEALLSSTASAPSPTCTFP